MLFCSNYAKKYASTIRQGLSQSDYFGFGVTTLIENRSVFECSRLANSI